jgi:hypothetical protein
MTILRGACHCGRIGVEFTTAQAASDLPLRACDCSFCRRHGAKTTSDPNGKLMILADAGAIERYRFGMGLTDFILCRTCGSYVAAVSREGQSERAALNVAGVAVPELAAREAAPVNLDQETFESRRERRRKVWTPVEILERAAA